MKKVSTQQGIIPIVIIIIAAIVVAGGAGTYQAVKKNKEKKAAAEAELMASATVDASIDVNATTTIEAKGNGSLRSLIARNKDVVCTVSTTHSSGSSEGTLYISGGMMRGDFTVKSTNAATMESHMIQNAGTMYMWSGSEGVKMDTTASGNAQASAQTQSSIDLDQNYGYDCKDWSKDASKFSVPSTVNFMDLNAMIKGQTQVQIPTGVKLNADGTVKAGM